MKPLYWVHSVGGAFVVALLVAVFSGSPVWTIMLAVALAILYLVGKPR